MEDGPEDINISEVTEATEKETADIKSTLSLPVLKAMLKARQKQAADRKKFRRRAPPKGKQKSAASSKKRIPNQELDQKEKSSSDDEKQDLEAQQEVSKSSPDNKDKKTKSSRTVGRSSKGYKYFIDAEDALRQQLKHKIQTSYFPEEGRKVARGPRRKTAVLNAGGDHKG